MFPPAMRRRSIRRRQHREDIHDLTSYAPEATMGSLREVQGVRQKTSRLPHQAYQSIAVRSLGTQTTLHANSTPRQRALQKLKCPTPPVVQRPACAPPATHHAFAASHHTHFDKAILLPSRSDFLTMPLY